ncbi:MAG: hypothetical protein P8J20_11225 [Novosphingobium sp.]|nr:hypothetical protein [Novosphingobium sp.]
MKPGRFSHIHAIDWSGAVGERHKGIALAMCDLGSAPPKLLTRDKPWSRADILAYLLEELPQDTLVGLDLGISMPFDDAGAFFPGWDKSPQDARSLWAFVDTICASDPHLSAGSFVDHHIASRYFRRHGGREGDLFHLDGAPDRRGRLRVTEQAQAGMGCKPYSNFNLVGAAQVGKSSLTGMRVLHRLAGQIPVWPIDPRPEVGSVIVEIYTALAAVAAGRSASRAKITDHDALNNALARLSSSGIAESGPIDDHSADALVTAAWLRANARRAQLWQPPGLSKQTSRTEGWTFGAC